jgi:hypothetical protein
MMIEILISIVSFVANEGHEGTLQMRIHQTLIVQ